MPSPLSEYRSKIKTLLMNKRELAELILDRKIPEENFDADIQVELDEHIFSYAFIPSFQGEAKTYLTFELEGNSVGRNSLYKNVTLHIFVYTHHSLMHPKSTHGQYSRYLRTDIMDDYVQEMFHNNLSFGVGKMRCTQDKFYKLNQDYYGRQLTFVVSDIAKEC